MRKLILTLVLLMAVPAEAAIAYVGGSSAFDTVSSVTATYTTHVGNTVVVTVTGVVCTSIIVADSAGNTYTQRVTLLNAGGGLVGWMYTAPVVSAATTTTATYGGCANQNNSITVTEYSGVGSVGGTVTVNIADTPTATLTLSAGGNWVVMSSGTLDGGTTLTATAGTKRVRAMATASNNFHTYTVTNTSAVAEAVTCSLSVSSNTTTGAIQLLLPPLAVIPGHHRRTISKGVQ